MIKSSYLSYLLSLIKTKSYADEVIENLDELKESLYNRRVDLDKKMSELFSYELKEKIKAYSWQEQINLNDPDSFGNFLLSLRALVKSMPVVTIQIAFEPTDELVKEICAWFVENFGKNVLIDLVYKKSLVGGAAIFFNGQIKDFSIQKKLDQKYKIDQWKKFMSQVRRRNTDVKSFTPLKNNKANNHLTTTTPI